MAEIKYTKNNHKYKSGQLYKHNKCEFIIQLIEKNWNHWSFRVVSGSIPIFLRPEQVLINPEEIYIYSICTIRTAFTLISGKGAEVLFGIKGRN